MRLDSAAGLTDDGDSLPKFIIGLGVHVDSLVRSLLRPEVVDVVASEIRNCASGVALSSISARLARHGC